VTWQHDWPSAQRLLARSWFRDGEVFAQLVFRATSPNIDHGTSDSAVDRDDRGGPGAVRILAAAGIVQGVELNAWGRATRLLGAEAAAGRRVPGLRDRPDEFEADPGRADALIKSIDRIRQIRGVSHFASVLNRLDDFKDYEERSALRRRWPRAWRLSSRRAAPEEYDAPTEEGNQRDLRFRPGMIFDDLKPGEEIGTIDTTRPNREPAERTDKVNCVRWRAERQSSYSSIAKDYSGTYSAQRQELVESYANYAILQAEFTSRIVRPTYEAAVALAVAAGLVKVPKEVVPASVDDAIYIGPQMPWIDPEAETKSWTAQEGALYASGPEIIRRRGQNPRDVLAQEARWRAQVKKAGLEMDLGATAPQPGAPTAAQPQRKNA
jgi:lambda family phage portal protein